MRPAADFLETIIIVETVTQRVVTLDRVSEVGAVKITIGCETVVRSLVTSDAQKLVALKLKCRLVNVT